MSAVPNTELDAVVELRARALGACAGLSRRRAVAGLCLVGSAARGDAKHDSDIDLLVLTKVSVTRAQLLRWVPLADRDRRLAFLIYEVGTWLEEASRGSLFLHHVRLEGLVLHDPEGHVARGFCAVAARPPDVAGEIERRVARLSLYTDLDRLNGQHLFALSHLYSIGKAVAMARCAQLGHMVFVKEDALSLLGAARPEWKDATDVIAALRPFYALTHERDGGSLPFTPLNAEDRIRASVGAIRLLADG